MGTKAKRKIVNVNKDVRIVIHHDAVLELQTLQKINRVDKKTKEKYEVEEFSFYGWFGDIRSLGLRMASNETILKLLNSDNKEDLRSMLETYRKQDDELKVLVSEFRKLAKQIVSECKCKKEKVV